MTRAMDIIEIPYCASADKLPSWRMGPSGFVTVACGDCGKRSVLRDGPNESMRMDGTHGHDISPEGAVRPSIVCPYKPCTWHVWARLMDWKV